jgi:hypothetical protein
MSNLRRYEILLPRQFNDGRPVPDHLVSDTPQELESRFGAVSWETQIIRGSWQHQGEPCHDGLFRVFVDVDDSPENREFLRGFKEQLRTSFQQIDIWLSDRGGVNRRSASLDTAAHSTALPSDAGAAPGVVTIPLPWLRSAERRGT